MRVARSALALAGLLLWSSTAAAQTVLTLEDVIARARDTAPHVVSARLAVEEARGRLIGASRRVTSNPGVELSVGARDGVGRSTDVQIGLAQQFDPPGGRAARMAGATASVDQATAMVDQTIRDLVRDAAAAFQRALHATERVRLLTTSEALAASIFATADRRFRAGELAVLDVNLARASAAGARAERVAADAELVGALGDLRILLGIEGPVTVRGTVGLPAPPDAAVLEAAVDQRPELRAIESAIREADAEVLVGRISARPAYGFVTRYEREAGDQIVFGGLTMSLPLFARGQEARAVGLARGTRLRAELDAARLRGRVALEAALAAYARSIFKLNRRVKILPA